MTVHRHIVSQTFLADSATPLVLYRHLQLAGLEPSLFESNEGGVRWGRFTLLIGEPLRRLYSDGGEVCLWDRDEGLCTLDESNPLRALRAVSADVQTRWENPDEAHDSMPTGGWYGLYGYNLMHHIEPRVPVQADHWSRFHEVDLVEPGLLVVYDHLTQKVRLSKVMAGEVSADAIREAQSELHKLWQAASRSEGLPPVSPEHRGEVQIETETDDADYERAVQEARDLISAGETIQVVLARRFSVPSFADPLDLYRVLRIVNPSPYLFMLSLSGGTLVGSSPEVMVRLRDGKIALRPIAGTRPRGRDKAHDLTLEKELLADPKERAEHLMLVDLGRNDVGRVARAGTVQVPEQYSVERYSHVMHIVSQVEGMLTDDKDAIDLLTATFPAGTVSGAPKIRAMEIIHDLEKEGRGPYSGAVGYIDYHGNMDTCIVIRTFCHTGDRISFTAGAGIVFDSVPERESEETLNKARALFTALGILAGR